MRGNRGDRAFRERRNEARALVSCMSLAAFSAVLAAGLPAQVGGHPHVAPLAPGFGGLLVPRKVSPLMNQADGSWNFGESPDGMDMGGVLGRDSLNAAMPTYEPHPATSGWHQHPQ